MRIELRAAPIIGIKRLDKITKHSAAVYPLEAYGILLGAASPVVLMVALPVGQTTRWDDPSDRFALIDRAVPIAAKTAAEFNMSVLGLYHSHCDRIHDSPLLAVPACFADILTVIKPVWGGEAQLYVAAFHLRNQSWRRNELPRIYLPRNRHINVRRIQSSWTRVWGPVEYRRSYDNQSNVT